MDPVLASIALALIVQIVTFVTLLVNHRQQRLREVQKRAWEVEDRAAVAQIASTSHREVLDSTAQAIGAAHSAYQEANHVNLKIEALAAAQLENPKLFEALDAIHKTLNDHDEWEHSVIKKQSTDKE